MKLPVISESTKRQVVERLVSFEDLEVYANQMNERLQTDNPNLARVLFIFRDSYAGAPWIWLGLACAYGIYEMFDLEFGGKMPVISTEVVEPMRVDFIADTAAFMGGLAVRLDKENPEVLELALSVAPGLISSDNPQDQEMARMITLLGLFVFRLLESQVEADNMKRSLL